MVLDAILENAVIYNVFYKLDVKVGQKFTLVMDKPDEMDDVFVNADKVLSHDRNGTDINLEALSVGTSKVRIMKDDPANAQNPVKIVREIFINVVDSIQRPAATLNVALGQPEPK